jgi:uncharacterized Zn-binding protein involved in type VI secretion
MYSTCLFCNRSLGVNEAVEHFPVGRRLAFDAARGRLWAVCRACGRWNLSPLDDRWEAIEECERLFQGTRLRASTDQIGLARVADGTELVRIGTPVRGEFAAWRYGDQFGKRRQQMVLRVGAVVAVGGVIVATHGFGLFAAGAVPGGSFLWQLPNIVNNARKQNMVVARGVDSRGRAYVMRGKHLGKARLSEPSAGLRLDFEHDKGPASVEGAEALRVGGLVLARLNANGAAKAEVQKAVVQIERAGGPEALLAREARVGPPPVEPKKHWSQWDSRRERGVAGSLKRSSPVTRLALEMAVNEENERRALEGELGALAEEWRAAEEIAQISDDMFLPESVSARLDALKADESRRGDPKRLLGPDGRPAE